jgi:hypothetical protein
MKKTLVFLSLAIAVAACEPKPQPGANSAGKPGGSAVRFNEASASSGLSFNHIPTRTENKWLPEIMGSGVGIADLNRDGAPDVVLVNGGVLNSAGRPAGA